MKIVNQDLWLGMFLASNGAKSFAHITLDFTIVFFIYFRTKLRYSIYPLKVLFGLSYFQVLPVG